MSSSPPVTGTTWLDGLRTAINPALARPQRASGVEIFPAPDGRGYVLRKLPESRYLRIEDEDLFVWECLDGEATVLEISRRYLARFGQIGLFRVEQLVELTRAAGMLADGPPDVVWAPLRRAMHRRTLAGRLAWVNQTFVYRQIPLPGMAPLFARLHRTVGRTAGHPLTLLLAVALAVGGFVRWLDIDHPHPAELTTRQLFVVGLLTIGSIVVHELGHGLAVHRTGREVTRAGAFIMYGTPGGFVDTSDMWLASRRQRIVVTLAGPATNLVLGGVAAIAAARTGSVGWAAFATGQYLLVLANLTPLLKLDGYYVLMDLTGVANLRERAMTFLPRVLPRRLRAAWAEGDLLPRLDRTETILLVYGVAAFGWLFLVGLVGLLLLPERMWQLGELAVDLGTRHWLGAGLAVAITATASLVVLQLVAQLAKLRELGRVFQVRYDRSHGWGATALVAAGCVVAGVVVPQMIASRSSTSADGWAHGLAAAACVLGAFGAGRGFVRAAGSSLRLVLFGLTLACASLGGLQVLAVVGGRGPGDRPAVAGALVALVALLVGRRATVSALLGDLRAGWAAVVVGIVLLLASVAVDAGTAAVGPLCIGLGSAAGARLLARPILARTRVVDIPAGEPATSRRSATHLRRAFAHLGEGVLADVAELFGPAERLVVLRTANEAAVDGGWRWWFVERGTLVDHTDGELSERARVYSASLARLVELVGERCDPGVALDAIAERRAELPPRLGALADEWLGDALTAWGRDRLGVDPHDDVTAQRFALRHLSRGPITEVEQAVGRPAVEAALDRYNAASTRAGWGVWFRANGRMLGDGRADNDTDTDDRAVLAMLYGQLVPVSGRDFVRRAVRFAADGLPPELRAAGDRLLDGSPWGEPLPLAHVRCRTVADWPVPG